MAATLRLRFWIELALFGASGICLMATLVWPDWIELVAHVDPDAHSGSAEWVLVGMSALATIVFAWLSRHEWRRADAGAVA